MRLFQETVFPDQAASENVGRAEYCLRGIWKIFCRGVGFDSLVTIVLCKQLGYNIIST